MQLVKQGSLTDNLLLQWWGILPFSTDARSVGLLHVAILLPATSWKASENNVSLLDEASKRHCRSKRWCALWLLLSREGVERPCMHVVEFCEDKAFATSVWGTTYMVFVGEDWLNITKSAIKGVWFSSYSF